MNPNSFHYIFAGGGTAGHLFPGLAVAEELAALNQSPRITFVGSGKPFEQRLVAAAGFEYLPLPCAPVSYSPTGILRFLAGNFTGFHTAKRFIRRNRVDAVVGLGGFVSVPMARAASALGRPLVLLEQNAIPGKATRWLAPRAELVCTAYESTRRHLDCVCPVRLTGNPIRAGFRPRHRKAAATSVIGIAASEQSAAMQRHASKQESASNDPRELAPSKRVHTQPKRLLVLGGSGGARSLNRFVPRAMYKLRDRLVGWSVIHQTGAAEVAATQELYRKFSIDAQATAFVQNLPAVMRSADLVICRAGATTLAEIAATGTPAVMIPYPRATDDHQRLNAQPYADAGAARLVDERTVAGRLDDAIVAAVSDLVVDDDRRREMSTAMQGFARPDAAWQVAMMIHDLVCRERSQLAA